MTPTGATAAGQQEPGKLSLGAPDATGTPTHSNSPGPPTSTKTPHQQPRRATTDHSTHRRCSAAIEQHHRNRSTAPCRR